MHKKFTKFTSIALAALAAPSLALAHSAGGETSGFAHGFGHPISGLDHILAMVMVGLFAFQLGGRALWLLPTTFVLAMAAGGAVGIMGVQMPFVESGIALSVLILGGTVALGIKAPAAAAMSVVGLFAIFHGHAHGAEMPEDAGGIAYAAGFLVATAILHMAGIVVGFVLGAVSERYGPFASRAAGGATAIAGAGLLAGLI